ncbi:MAG TPA: lipopolysaccharide biosynthesis protein [Acidimicrobiales bacterium]|nr:lipopolysaccharide biosynthesis protein [Acidimicrobiales bacterium]
MRERRTWKNVGLPFLVLRLAGQGGEFAAFVVLARQLDTDDFGRLSIAFLIARYFGLVADWGASVRGTRDVARGDDAGKIDALLRRRTQVSIVLTGAFAVGAWALIGPALVPLAVLVLARGLNRDWLALGRERGWASGIASLVQGIALLAFAPLARTASAAAGALAVAYVVGLAVSLILNRRPTPADREKSSDTVPVDGWILGALLADQITISADTLLLGLLRSSSAAGVYAAVYRIPGAWMTVIGLVVFGTLATTTRLVSGGTKEESRAVQRRSVGVGLLTAGAILVSAFPAYVLVPTVFGPAYSSGRTPLLILMVATAVMAITASMHPLYVALAQDRDVFTLSLSGALVNLVANSIAIPLGGLAGAASATLVAQLALLGFVLARLRRLLL